MKVMKTITLSLVALGLLAYATAHLVVNHVYRSEPVRLVTPNPPCLHCEPPGVPEL